MNNTLSKEEILDKHIDISFDNILELNYGKRADGIHAAMGEYAKQEVIDFLHWLISPRKSIYIYSGSECFYINGVEATYEQVYEQYLLHKQNKEQ